MTFFLSKFLPALLFPLGMACLLIAVSLIAQLRKRSRMAIATNLAALAVLCLMGNSAVAHLLVRPLETRVIPAARLPQADAIVVFGGALQGLLFHRSQPFI
jgi:uncharacterized SAM-binding protein YcdF (DUF218 family)